MIKKFHHYRDFEFEKHVFFFSDVPPTNIEDGKSLKDKNGENVSDDQFKKQSWKELERDKRKEYRTALHEIASRLTGKSGKEEEAFSEPIKSTMRGSRSRFDKAVDRIEADYYDATRPPELAYKQAQRRVNREVRQNLRGLKRSVKATMALEAFMDSEMPDPSNEKQIEKHFEDYKKLLNKRYFNQRLDRAGGEVYLNKVDEFKSNVDRFLQTKIYFLQEAKAPKALYKEIQIDMEARYKRYANFDGDPSSISLKDLDILDKRTKPPATPKEEVAILNEDEVAQKSRLEDIHFATPEKWTSNALESADLTLDRVQSDKAEASFVKVVNERIAPVKDFESAKKVYKKRMREVGKLGAEKTLTFSESLNTAIFDDTFSFEKEAYEGSLGLQTQLQMQYMQSGTITPPKPTDRMLIKFINAHEQERSEILRDPKRRADLFQGIKEATEAYPVELEGRFNDFDENNKPKRAREIAHPTPDDLTARLKALIVLGEQSQILVERYGYGDALSEVEVDPEEVRADLKFVVHGDGRVPPQYQPGIARSGFNGTDIILRGTQVATCLMLVSNLAYQVRSAEGTGVEQWTNGIVNAVTSPHTLAYAALAYGTTKVIEDKRYINYPWLGPYGKEGLNTADKLNGIAEKTSPKYMNEFRNSMAEWQILKRIEEADKMEEVMELVGKQEGQKTINAALLVKAGVLEENGDHLIKQKMARNARTRYLFYDKFRGKKVKTIKQHCTGSVFIESESERVANND